MGECAAGFVGASFKEYGLPTKTCIHLEKVNKWTGDHQGIPPPVVLEELYCLAQWSNRAIQLYDPLPHQNRSLRGSLHDSFPRARGRKNLTSPLHLFSLSTDSKKSFVDRRKHTLASLPDLVFDSNLSSSLFWRIIWSSCFFVSSETTEIVLVCDEICMRKYEI